MGNKRGIYVRVYKKRGTTFRLFPFALLALIT